MHDVPRPPSRVFSLALALTALITPLAVHLFLPVIPAVKAALALTDAEAQLTFSIALFAMAFATLFYGSLSDRFGRRPVLLSGLTLFLIGSMISVMAQTVATLAFGRLVQAIGAGCRSDPRPFRLRAYAGIRRRRECRLDTAGVAGGGAAVKN